MSKDIDVEFYSKVKMLCAILFVFILVLSMLGLILSVYFNIFDRSQGTLVVVVITVGEVLLGLLGFANSEI